MDTLHAPTVPSGPRTAPTANGDSKQLGFTELQRRKLEIEAELAALGGVLDSHGVNMDTPLLTADGFPRADIDVAQIRTTRARIIRRRNDYNDLMAKVEKFLHEHFTNLDENAEEPALTSGTGFPVLPDSIPETLDEPFAKVEEVAQGGPADDAGLKPGDLVRNFGYVSHENHNNLREVAACVQTNEGGNIFVKVSRAVGVTDRQELRLTLVPRRNWGGRGLLGCYLRPLTR